MPESAERSELEAIEQASALTGDDPMPAVAVVAARSVEIDDAELRAARRRALLILATGGDPHREIDFDGVALRRLASELERPERRGQLEAALAQIRDSASDLPAVRGAAEALIEDSDFAWRLFAVSVLVDEFAADD